MVPTTSWSSLWSLNAADYFAVAVTVAAALKVLLGRPSLLVRRYRRRYLRRLDVPAPDIRRRVRVIRSGARIEAAEELSWLADVLKVPSPKALVFEKDDPDLERYARAYEQYAARIDRGVLLGATRAPLVEREVTLCRQVSALLRDAQYRNRFDPAHEVLSIPHREAVLELHGRERQDPGAAEGSTVAVAEFVPSDLAVSYRRHRVVIDTGRSTDATGTLREEVLPITPDLRRLVKQKEQSPHYFDGTLPRLTGVRMERDLSSGRHAFHVALAETSYFALVVDHYPQQLVATGATDEPASGSPGIRAGVTGERVRLFTLASVLRTSCGHLVFVKKSERAGSYARMFGPTISGNLEFWPRQGLTPDSSASGLPDPLRALAREAHEELGIRIDPAALVTVGVATITVPDEVRSNVLLTCGPLDLDLDALRLGAQDADPVEGAWEVGPSMLALRFPRTEDELDDAIDWLVGSSELNAHATLAGLGALSTFGNVPDVFARALRSAGRRGEVDRPRRLVRELDLMDRPLDLHTAKGRHDA